MNTLQFFKDDKGKIRIKEVPLNLLSSIRGIGNVTIEKLKLLRDIDMLNLESTVQALPSQYFNKADIDEMFTFEMVPPRILHSQSDSNMASEKCAEPISGSRSCFVETELRPKSCLESKMSTPACAHTATAACPAFAAARDNEYHVISDMSEDRYSTQENTFETSKHLNPRAQPFVFGKNEPRIKIKASSLPTFSGNRIDWPEFKVLWPALVERLDFDELQLCMELKRACKGRAGDRLKNITSGIGAYSRLWDRLLDEYDDPSLSCQEALSRMHSLKPVAESDYKGMLKLIDVIEGTYNQLDELGQLQAVHAIDVDRVANLLPPSTKMVWLRTYQDLSRRERVAPFKYFWGFLSKERGAVARLAESTGTSVRRNERAETHFAESKNNEEFKMKAKENKYPVGSSYKKSEGTCAVCDVNTHTTEICSRFRELSVHEKYQALKMRRLCFACLSPHHRRENCSKKCGKCGKGHHVSLCKMESASADCRATTMNTSTSINGGNTSALYPICKVPLAHENEKRVNVFCDGGSNASYITRKCAHKHRFKKEDSLTLTVTTVGGKEKQYRSCIYEVPLKTINGKIVKVHLFELPEITKELSKINIDVVRELFPDYDATLLARDGRPVDILLGTDQFSLHPKQELDCSGENLSIMGGELGICLVGTHAKFTEPTQINHDHHPQTLHLQTHHTSVRREHPAFHQAENFIAGEELGTECHPRCGGCKCGKCPLPGHDLSFKEEQERHMIRSGLKYDEQNKFWITSYPWLKNPETLPDNYNAALKTLQSTENSLRKDPQWAKTYTEQITDMKERGVVRRLEKEEIEKWSQPCYYISHLAVSNPKSQSTPVRMVFNSAQVYKGVSLNSYLAKGPDSYRNTLLGILLRWREEAIPIVGDIRKMFHQVRMELLEQHCHRFLWRDMESAREPDIYAILRVTMGDRPAPAIATEALFKTAEMCRDDYPRAAEFILNSSYVDDLIDSVSTPQEAVELAQETEYVLAQGGFRVKCWQSTTEKLQGNELKRTEEGNTGVLGVSWNPKEDSVSTPAVLNFSDKKHGHRTEPNLKMEDLPHRIPDILTKRLVLQQTMSMYDPLGLVAPFTLKAKILLREAWRLELDWDDPLPPTLYQSWVKFFRSMFLMENLSFPRCLKPSGVVGDPWLILMSDGSELAYGAVAYVRWQCADGTIEVRLLMSKCRISPVNKVSIPRMELNGAVLSTRLRACISREIRYKFSKIIHLVDSETVLSMIHKTSYRFKAYEGIRLGEIQSCTQPSDWAWIPGELNVADWLTRGKDPGDLDNESLWQTGPPMLRSPIEEWDIKYSVKSLSETVTSTFATEVNIRPDILRWENFRSKRRAIMVVARLLGIGEKKSFGGGRSEWLNPEVIKKAETYLIKEAQQGITEEYMENKLKTLSPAKSGDIWVVGVGRLASNNPLGIYSDLPIFLPRDSPLAKLAMLEAHEKAHQGRDATLAAFRSKFWTPSGAKMAKSITKACLLCKLRMGKHLNQQMGPLPEERSTPSPPFNFTMVDLFGPMLVRGEVQKRTSMKVWGVLFVDMVARAVHLEMACGYDTQSFMLAFRRFVSIRGWPQILYSDVGSQLVGASNELKAALSQMGCTKGMEWRLGCADAPWHQGAAEALIKSVKKALLFSIHKQRLSVPELMTVFTETANLVNERPLGVIPDIDSDINILTPNCLLLGRASAENPGVWSDRQLKESTLTSRSSMVSATSKSFWTHWLRLFAPSLVYRKKWHERERELRLGDVVLVLEDSSFQNQYRLAKVTETFTGKDGIVRRVAVAYKNTKLGEKPREYKGVGYTTVLRSCQRLILIVPVEEQGSQ